MARKPKTSFDIPTIQDAVVAPAAVEQVADNATYSRSRCGGALRLARETQGLSVQDVASKLRLGPKQIEAIEADQFEKLPEPTIVRGFIRNYAKLLRINAEPLLDAYTVIVPSNAQHELTVKPTSNMQVTSGDKPKASSYIWAVLALLVAVGAWLFYQNYIQKPSPTAPSASIESLSNQTVESLPVPALPAAERAQQASSIELALPPAPAADAPVSPQSEVATATTKPATNMPNSASAVAVPPAEAVSAPTPAGMAKLEFNATQETWVDIVDASGRKIFSKIIFAGSRESIDVTLPVNITVGNAGATSLNMNDKVIHLAPHSRNNVAHVKLE